MVTGKLGILCARLLLGLLVLASAEDGDGLGRPAKRLASAARSAARASSIRDYHREKLTDALDGVPTEEVLLVIEALRADEKPGRSLPAVLDFLESAYVERRYGEEAAKRVPDLLARLEADDPASVKALLAESLGIEDPRLATKMARKAAGAEERDVRLAAATALGDLVELEVRSEEIDAAFAGLLADGSPAVRARAARRAFAARFDPVVPWAIEHVEDDAREEAVVAGAAEKLCPGREAFDGLKALTRIQDLLDHDDFLKRPEVERDTIANLYRSWWEARGSTFPAPGFRKGRFSREVAGAVSAVVEIDRPVTRLRLWSKSDGSRFRVLVHEIREIEVPDSAPKFHFAVKYLAEGRREERGDAYARNVPARHAWALPRKDVGCYVLLLQPLLGDRLKILLRFHDPVN